jgi:hypothetical protein
LLLDGVHAGDVSQGHTGAGHDVVVALTDRIGGLLDEGGLDDVGDLLFGRRPIEPWAAGRRGCRRRRCPGQPSGALLQQVQGCSIGRIGGQHSAGMRQRLRVAAASDQQLGQVQPQGRHLRAAPHRRGQLLDQRIVIHMGCPFPIDECEKYW